MAYMSSSMLRLQWLPSQIEVINTIVDIDPPMLVNFTASMSSMAVTVGSVTIEWQMVALDNVSGLQYAYLSVSGPDYCNSTQIKMDGVPVGGGTSQQQPTVFHLRCTHHRSGKYMIEVGLQYATAHYLTLYSEDLIAMGWSGSFFLSIPTFELGPSTALVRQAVCSSCKIMLTASFSCVIVVG
jgi:hypothetical protein